MKNKKIAWLISLIAFFFVATPVLARQMTIKELGDLALSKKQDTKYIYIVGNYAFTSVQGINQQDIMLASKSINLTKEFDGTNLTESLKAMQIYTVVPVYDDYYQITDWKYDNNLVGETGEAKDGSQKLDIRYIDYEYYAEVSATNFAVDVENSQYSTYKDVLKEKLHFETDKFYGKGDENITINGNKITGLLLKNNSVSLSPEDKQTYAKANYFLALIIEVPNATEKATIKIANLNGEKTSTYANFDVLIGSGKTPGMVSLMPIDYEKWNKDGGKTITITVDADGSDHEYGETTYTFDISGLMFQGDSSATLESNYDQVAQSDKTTLTSWGYNDSVNKNVTLADGKLSGTLVEQQLTNNDAFGKDNKDGYYFTFTIKPEGMTPETKDTVVVKQLKSDNLEDVAKTYQRSEFDSEGNLTILYQFPAKSTKCTENCKIYFSVDLDGDGDKYLPKIYTIDYSNNLIFEKASTFTVDGLAGEEDFGHGWEEKNGYKTTVIQDSNDPHKYMVSGLLPIFADTDWDSDPFTSEQQDYYLGLLLKLTNLTEDMKSTPNEIIEVKFIHDGEEDTTNSAIKLYGSDFSSKGELHILKYLNPNAKTKQFQITIDLDGQKDDSVDEFAPYTVIIDYTDLKFQTYSTGYVVNNFVASETDLESDTSSKEYLSNFEYNYDADAAVTLTNNTTIGGTIKEQTLDSQAGFQDGNRGYFIPVKIKRPFILPAEYQKQWTLTLNTEDGKQKEYTPTEEEYTQGWVLVLFKVTEGGSEVKYKIDFDGPNNYDYLPTEYTIKYDGLEFLASNEVTFVYIDKDGTQHNDKEIIYENEQLGHNLATDQDTDSRKFVGWYDATSKTLVEETKTFGEHEDVTVNAHWKLYADKFITSVVNDLNSDDTTYSDKFTDFTLNKGEADNKITINLNKVNTPLSDLAKTSIPGAIAYILNKGEIQDITLQVDGGNSVTFNKDYINDTKEYSGTADRDNDLLGEAGVSLKKEIIEGAKETFDSKLNDNEETAKLDQLEYDNTKFTIKIGNPVDDTVELVDNDGQTLADDKKTYTFEFDADFVGIDQDGELGAKDLKTAIESDKNYTTYYINGDYELYETLTLTDENITIESSEVGTGISLADANRTKLSTKSGDYVIEVTSGNVTIDNLNLAGGTKAELNVKTGATVKVENLDLSKDGKDTLEEGIYVEKNGTLNVQNIKFDGESNDVPAVRGYYYQDINKPIESANITYPNSTLKRGNIIKVEKKFDKWCIDKGTGPEECKTYGYPDAYEVVSDSFYYVDGSVYKNYFIVSFMDSYNFENFMHKIYEPSDDHIDPKIFAREKQYTYKPKDSETTYYFVGWGKYRTGFSTSNFADIYTDWNSINPSSKNTYFAYYAEQDHKITISAQDVEGIDSTDFYTYKFVDTAKNGGMKIGELKKIDSKFAEVWKKLEDAKAEKSIKIEISGSEKVDATDDTVISADATITIE